MDSMIFFFTLYLHVSIYFYETMKISTEKILKINEMITEEDYVDLIYGKFVASEYSLF